MSVPQAIEVQEGYQCSECYRLFAGKVAFSIHTRTGSCQVGQAVGLIGELSRSNQIVWSDTDIEWGASE